MSREAMQMAMDAITDWGVSRRKVAETVEALRTALAQPEHEPVGRFAKFSDGIWKEVTDGSAGQPLYAAPPQSEWIGLTENELSQIHNSANWNHNIDWSFERAIEAKLKEKNT